MTSMASYVLGVKSLGIAQSNSHGCLKRIIKILEQVWMPNSKHFDTQIESDASYNERLPRNRWRKNQMCKVHHGN